MIVVSSPSGAGKTTLCRGLLEEFDNLRFSTSHTTRRARSDEVDGRDYFFVSDEKFDDMVDKDMFLEWAYVHGNRYGTARAEVRAAATAGKDLLFDVDYQGARQIKDQHPEAVGVFVLPPSIEELQRRLRERGTETPESLERRFKAALGEIAHYGLFDYITVNDDLDTAYDQIRSVLIAERIKCSRTKNIPKDMLEIG